MVKGVSIYSRCCKLCKPGRSSHSWGRAFGPFSGPSLEEKEIIILHHHRYRRQHHFNRQFTMLLTQTPACAVPGQPAHPQQRWNRIAANYRLRERTFEFACCELYCFYTVWARVCVSPYLFESLLFTCTFTSFARWSMWHTCVAFRGLILNLATAFCLSSSLCSSCSHKVMASAMHALQDTQSLVSNYVKQQHTVVTNTPSWPPVETATDSGSVDASFSSDNTDTTNPFT